MVGPVINEATLLGIVHAITRSVELLGILVILAGASFSAVRFARDVARWRTANRAPDDRAANDPAASDRAARPDAVHPYKQLRANLGRSILLGLELLVAADIINTVAVAPTLDRLAVLAGIVLIRTFLSVSLEVEIDGRWPWQSRTRDDAEGPDRSNKKEAGSERA